MFGNEHLKALVECAGRALEFEDRYLTGCAHVRGWKTIRTGIWANINERYYQFVVWRALMSSFPWRPHTEAQTHDLAFYEGESNELVGVAEMKVWYGKTYGVEAIRADVQSLRKVSVPAVMLIIAGLPKERTEERLEWLAEKIEVSRQDFVTYTFDTVPCPPDPPPRHFRSYRVLRASRADGAIVSPTGQRGPVPGDP